MLRKATEIIGSTIRATDGDIGSVATLFFDDERWTIRYFVVDTGNWLPGRKVLISPISVRQVSWADRSVDVSLTREQVKNSPDIDTEQPVSRQHEVDYFAYYGYPYYWPGPGVWGAAAMPTPTMARADLERGRAEARAERETTPDENSRLRDAGVVKGYHVQATDGSIGHLEDFVIDDQSWTIRYAIVDTSNWIGGRRVLISPRWIGAVSWPESKVHVRMTRDEVQNSPEYDVTTEIGRAYEERLHTHYRQAGYWAERDLPALDEDDALAARDRLARLDAVDALEVADGDPDVRDWTVRASDGVEVGRVEHLIVDRPAMTVRYLEIGLQPSAAEAAPRDVLVPLEYVDLDHSKQEVCMTTVPSARVAALPTFTGLPLDPGFEDRCRAHFVTRAGTMTPGRDMRLTAARRDPPAARTTGGVPRAATRHVPAAPASPEHIVNRSPDDPGGGRRDSEPPREPRRDDEDPSR